MRMKLSVMQREGRKCSPEICHFPGLLTALLSLQYTGPDPAVYPSCEKQGAIHYSEAAARRNKLSSPSASVNATPPPPEKTADG